MNHKCLLVKIPSKSEGVKLVNQLHGRYSMARLGNSRAEDLSFATGVVVITMGKSLRVGTPVTSAGLKALEGRGVYVTKDQLMETLG